MYALTAWEVLYVALVEFIAAIKLEVAPGLTKNDASGDSEVQSARTRTSYNCPTTMVQEGHLNIQWSVWKLRGVFHQPR